MTELDAYTFIETIGATMKNSATFLGQSGDAVFRQWLNRVSGFYVNLKTQTSGTLHRIPCQHLDGTEIQIVNHAKICANSVEELRTWAKDKQITLDVCKDCKPE